MALAGCYGNGKILAEKLLDESESILLRLAAKNKDNKAYVATPLSREQADALFDELDTTKSGTLTLGELRKGIDVIKARTGLHKAAKEILLEANTHADSAELDKNDFFMYLGRCPECATQDGWSLDDLQCECG
eukprot:SAG31_NODE_3266_length_4472_cov_4.101142_6_plen_133_part_00